MVSPTERPRLLIFVVAYFAETTLRKVLDRIPRMLFEKFRCEVLVVDDASHDGTFAIGQAYRAAHPELSITVLRNAYNQGYGGNQKVGYAYAIQEGFDWVAMIHGDGQYAPEELPRLLQAFERGEADAVFGSRMMVPLDALKGGMPLYKYVGNKVLTSIQNRLLGSRLSEFHSGYRIYAVETLRKIPFALNSNDFHFDTEIIIQLLNARARILELPIPTFYGSEVCRVDGMKYAKDVLLATARNAAHRTGIFYQRKFDTTPEPPYTAKLDYPSSHSLAMQAVPAGAKVLDLGQTPDGLRKALEERGCQIDSAPNETAPAADDIQGHDVLLLLDAIERWKDPERMLEELRQRFTHDKKKLVLTTANAAFVSQRIMLLLGQMNYGRSGILDKSHARLFTFRSVRQLLGDAGFQIRRIDGIPAPFPKAFGPGRLANAALWANQRLIRVSKTLFAYEILVEAESTPSLNFLLQSAKASAAPARKTRARVRADAGGRKRSKKTAP